MKVFCKDCMHYGICEYSPFSDKKIECKDFICKADYVEVVKCKDCKHYKNWDDGNITCSLWTVDWDVPTEPNAFCSYGEKKMD